MSQASEDAYMDANTANPPSDNTENTWISTGRGIWKNSATGELKRDGNGIPAPLTAAEVTAWRQSTANKTATVNKLRDNILAQGTSSKWSGEGYGGPTANATQMATKLYDNGITRLEDFGQRDITQKVNVVRSDQIQYTDDEGILRQVPISNFNLMRGSDGNLYRIDNNEWGSSQGDRVDPSFESKVISQYGYNTEDYNDDYGNVITFNPLKPEQLSQVKDGQVIIPTGQKENYNKTTGKVISQDYNQTGGSIWSGTYNGDGRTNFGVHFNETGMPIFYTQFGGSTSDWGAIAPIVSIAAMIPGPHQPFALAINAIGQYESGNKVGAVLSALGAANAYGQAYNTLPTEIGTQSFDIDTLGDYAAAGVDPSAANWLATNSGAITSATQGVQLLNALDKNNLAGVIGSLANISPQIGVTIPEDLMKPIQYAAIASAASKGDWTGATLAAATLTNNSNVKLANSGLNLVKAFESGDPSNILRSVVGFAKQADLSGSVLKDTARRVGLPLSDSNVSQLMQSTVPSETDDIINNWLKEAKTVRSEYEKTFGQPIPDEILDQISTDNGLLSGYNDYVKNWNTDRNTTNQTEFTSYLADNGLKISDLSPDQVFQALSLSEANAKTYAQNIADIKSVTFDGNKYASSEEALSAAQQAGYNNFERDGALYTFMTGTAAQKIAKAANDGELAGISPNDFKKIDGQPFKWVSESDIPEIVITAKRIDAPSFTDTKAYNEYLDFVKENGGQSFPKWLSDQLAITTDLYKNAPAGSAASVIMNGLAFGSRNFGNLASTLLRGAEAMGLDPNNSALKVSQAFERWGAKTQSNGILEVEKNFKDGLNNISKASLAAEMGVPVEQVKDWQVAARQLKELGNQTVKNPLGTLSVVGGEALQEIPFLIASGGIGSVAAKMVGRTGGFAVARGTDAALNGFESFSGNYAEVKDHLIKQGVPPSKAETRALASGLEAMAVTAATSWVGDTAALKVFMKEMGNISASAVVGAGAKEYLLGYVEGGVQNISAQIGKFGEVRNMAEVTAASALEGFVQGGLTTGVLSSDALSQVVAKGYDGAGVTLNEILTGAKTFDPSTLARSAVLAGGITINNALQYNDLSLQGLNATPAQYTNIVSTFQSEGYTPTTAEIVDIANSNTDATGADLASADLASAVSKYADPLNTSTDEAKQFFKEIFGVGPTESQLASFVGKTESETKTLAKTQFDELKAQEAEVRAEATRQTEIAETARLAREGVEQAAAEAEAERLRIKAEAIRVEANNLKTATSAGFPDFDTYTQFNGDLAAYNSSTQAAAATTAINNAIAGKNLVTDQALTTALSGLSTDVQTKFDSLSQAQKDLVTSQTQQGVDLTRAINNAALATSEQIAGVKTDLTQNITDVKTQFDTRVDELMRQGQTYQAATDAAMKELGTGVTGLQTSVADLKKQETDRVAAEKEKTETARQKSALDKAVSLVSTGAVGAAAADFVDNSTTGFKDIGYKNTGETKFESVLSPFEKMVEENSYANKPQQQTEQQTQQQQVAPVNQQFDPQKDQQGSVYFNYGTSNEIDQMLGGGDPGTQMLYSKAGGLATPLFAGGGTTRHGRYAGGGLNVVHHAGKPRIDFRTGDAVTGEGDGQSDDIPAMLADGEFVFPADVVAALGNGSTKAGSDKLYDMMHSIRAYHRSAKPKDLPPPAKKSPLDYLTKPARKARR